MKLVTCTYLFAWHATYNMQCWCLYDSVEQVCSWYLFAQRLTPITHHSTRIAVVLYLVLWTNRMFNRCKCLVDWLVELVPGHYYIGELFQSLNLQDGVPQGLSSLQSVWSRLHVAWDIAKGSCIAGGEGSNNSGKPYNERKGLRKQTRRMRFEREKGSTTHRW